MNPVKEYYHTHTQGLKDEQFDFQKHTEMDLGQLRERWTHSYKDDNGKQVISTARQIQNEKPPGIQTQEWRKMLRLQDRKENGFNIGFTTFLLLQITMDEDLECSSAAGRLLLLSSSLFSLLRFFFSIFPEEIPFILSLEIKWQITLILLSIPAHYRRRDRGWAGDELAEPGWLVH